MFWIAWWLSSGVGRSSESISDKYQCAKLSILRALHNEDHPSFDGRLQNFFNQKIEVEESCPGYWQNVDFTRIARKDEIELFLSNKSLRNSNSNISHLLRE